MVEKKFAYKNAKISSRKAGLTLNLLQGYSLRDAKSNLTLANTKASDMWLKLVKSAIAGSSDTSLIKEAYVGPSRSRTKYRFAGKGTVKPEVKRSSHLTLVVNSDAKVNVKKEDKAVVSKKSKSKIDSKNKKS